MACPTGKKKYRNRAAALRALERCMFTKGGGEAAGQSSKAGTIGVPVSALQPLSPDALRAEREIVRPLVIEFELRGHLPPSMNEIKTMGPFKYKRVRGWVAKEVWVATNRKRPQVPLHRVRVDIVRYGRGLLDDDNLPSCAKMLLDVMQPRSKRCPDGLGIIYSDDPEHCKTSVTQHRVGKGQVRMTVRIEEVP